MSIIKINIKIYLKYKMSYVLNDLYIKVALKKSNNHEAIDLFFQF